MTFEEIEKYVCTIYEIDVSITEVHEDYNSDFENYDYNDYVREINQFIENYQYNHNNIEISFFTGCAACFPYITCKSGVKDESVQFIKEFISFTKEQGIMVSL